MIIFGVWNGGYQHLRKHPYTENDALDQVSPFKDFVLGICGKFRGVKYHFQGQFWCEVGDDMLSKEGDFVTIRDI